MENKYTRLLSPGKINSMTLKNRIIFPPMAFHFNSNHGATSEQTIEFYARLARGGAAMVIITTMRTKGLADRPKLETLAVHQKPMTEAPDRLDLRKHVSRVTWDAMDPVPALNPSLYGLVEAVQVHGSKICAAITPNPVGWVLENYDIDDIECQGLGLFNKLPTSHIEETIREYSLVAGELQNIGFDAIEMNFAYFPDYFAHESFNKRDDKYGGKDVESRLRYHQELIQATRAEVGPDFPLLAILDADHFGAKGWRTLDETKVVVKKFEEWGIDAVRPRGGGSVKVQYDIVPQYLPKGVDIHLAAGLKEVLSVPVISNSKLSDPDLAEQVLADGKGDFISIGRGLIADPDLPRKLLYGQTDRIRKCLSCNIGCFGNLTLLPRRPSRCTVNPIFGHESKLSDYVEPATQKKRVVIVGAGPGGMSAALTACQRGHDVVLFEKSESLGGGGHFHQATIAPFKQENLFVSEYYEREFKEYQNLNVVFNTTANADTVLKEKPDMVIIATGGSASVPELPGADGSPVVTYEDVLLERREVGDHVVILGGGSVGSETGLFLLLKKGKRVTILERLYRLADSVEIATRNCLMEELEKAGAEMIPDARVSAISGSRVSYIRGGEESTIEGDTVVLALGAKPENQLYDDLRYEKISLHVIGDARVPRTIMHAVSEGFFATYRS